MTLWCIGIYSTSFSSFVFLLGGFYAWQFVVGNFQLCGCSRSFCAMLFNAFYRGRLDGDGFDYALVLSSPEAGQAPDKILRSFVFPETKADASVKEDIFFCFILPGKEKQFGYVLRKQDGSFSLFLSSLCLPTMFSSLSKYLHHNNDFDYVNSLHQEPLPKPGRSFALRRAFTLK